MISRSGLESAGAEGGGYLQPGDSTATIGYRHVYSHVHFSGPIENTYRDQLGTPIQQKTNLEDLTVTYQITPRFSMNAMLPFFSASRRAENQFATLHTSGLSDITIGGDYWIRSPKSLKSATNNVRVGLGLLVPSGRDHIQDNVVVTPGQPQQLQNPDYSAQPGIGAWAGIFSAEAFQSLGNQTIAYCNGTYIMTQGGHHDFWTSHGGTTTTSPAPTPGLTQFDAIQDAYVVEIGAAHPAPKVKGLTMTLSIRDEGVPAYDIIGDSLGFRRSGFSINLTPGFIYNRGPHMLQFSVGKAMFRDRTRSAAEIKNNVHEGDAAFANYVWMAAWTLKLPKKHGGEEESGLKAPSGGAVTKASRTDTFKPFKLQTLDGTNKTLPDYLNKVTLVSFFFPRCPSCNAELPHEQKIYDKYKDKGLSMVWINILPDEEELVAGWEIKRHLNVPVLVGASQESLERDYQVTSTPTNYLLGEKGEVLFRQSGYKLGDEKGLEAKIIEALNGAAVNAGP